jgi:hypothetical protein
MDREVNSAMRHVVTLGTLFLTAGPNKISIDETEYKLDLQRGENPMWIVGSFPMNPSDLDLPL